VFSFSGCEEEEQGQWMDGYSLVEQSLRGLAEVNQRDTPGVHGT
jgi:hypothetical protein